MWGYYTWKFLEQSPVKLFTEHIDADTNKNHVKAVNNDIVDKLAKVALIRLCNDDPWESTRLTDIKLKLHRQSN